MRWRYFHCSSKSKACYNPMYWLQNKRRSCWESPWGMIFISKILRQKNDLIISLTFFNNILLS